MNKAELLVDARAVVGEGPWWDSALGVLYWIDIKGKSLHIYDPGTGSDRRLSLAGMPGAVVARKSGGLIMAMEEGFAFVDPGTGIAAPFLDPEAHLAGNRFNDGKCDSRGRFWAGTMEDAENEWRGSLYRLDPELRCERLFGGIGISNGIAFSPDDTLMYYIDTWTRRVDAFDFELETGAISRRRTAFEVPESMGGPDGMTIDEEGMLWVALWGGWGLGRWDPRTGRLLEKIDLPVEKVSSCVFGAAGRGPSALDKLYITTASVGLRPDDLKRQPAAGGLFILEPGVKGLPATPFAG